MPKSRTLIEFGSRPTQGQIAIGRGLHCKGKGPQGYLSVVYACLANIPQILTITDKIRSTQPQGHAAGLVGILHNPGNPALEGMGVWASEGTCVLESLSGSSPPDTNSSPIEKPTLHVEKFTGESFLGYAGPGLVFPGCVPAPELCSLSTVRGVKSSQ